jgi:ferredoxin--NADP+ reductase
MTLMDKWVQGKVVGKRAWTDRLVSLQVEAPEVTFVAGQFGRLALPAPPGFKEEMLGRPYSFVNSPDSPPHEFYFIVLPDGPLSPRLAALGEGEPVWLLRNANGFFCIGEVPAADALWCLATGTGLGPYLSILRTATWESSAACARPFGALRKSSRTATRSRTLPPRIPVRSRTFRW